MGVALGRRVGDLTHELLDSPFVDAVAIKHRREGVPRGVRSQARQSECFERRIIPLVAEILVGHADELTAIFFADDCRTVLVEPLLQIR